MIVIVEEEVRKEGGAVITGPIRAGVGPLTGDGLDEAFCLAVGLRAVRLGEEMFDAQLVAGGGKVMRAVGSAAVSKDALDGDAMSLVELNGLMESGNDTPNLFIGQQTGESQARMIIDCDVEALDSGMTIADGAISSGAHSGTRETAQFLDIQVKEFAGMSTLVANDRRLGRLQRGEPMQAMTAQDAGNGGLGDLQHREDLCVGAPLPAQGKDVGFELGAGPAGLPLRD